MADFTIKRMQIGVAYPRNGNVYKGGTPRYVWIVMLGDRPCGSFGLKRHARDFILTSGNALRAEFGL
ncbi:MAG TPA: hypothetical protein PL072_07640 [Phycisphaerales bacterium]|nr:hypothetical protein [Phycisphaerales bacterium]